MTMTMTMAMVAYLTVELHRAPRKFTAKAERESGRGLLDSESSTAADGHRCHSGRTYTP
jgi:hypothetical protein